MLEPILLVALFAIYCGSSTSDRAGPSAPAPATTGAITFTVRTIGDQVDQDSYQIVLDGAVVPAPVAGEITIEDLALGLHSIDIEGIATNCRWTNRPVSQNTVVIRETVEFVELVILCLRPNPGRIYYTTLVGTVHTISALGGDRVTLPVRANSVAVSSTHGRITFGTPMSSANTPIPDIWVADSDGSDPLNLTNTPGPAEIRPSWSTDGSQITYMRQEVYRGPQSFFDLFVMNADGSGVTNLTPNTTGWTDGEPAWSPDGTRIVFRSHRTGRGDLYTIRPDGTDLIQLTTDGNFDTNAKWSPDGTEIVFARFGDNVNDWDLFRINPDGSGLTQLTSDRRRSTEADWSPDGQWIVFASGRQEATEFVFDLFLMRRDGSDRVQLTFDELAGHPVWIP
jgi:tricorn protease-like protein